MVCCQESLHLFLLVFSGRPPFAPQAGGVFRGISAYAALLLTHVCMYQREVAGAVGRDFSSCVANLCSHGCMQ